MYELLFTTRKPNRGLFNRFGKAFARSGMHSIRYAHQLTGTGNCIIDPTSYTGFGFGKIEPLLHIASFRFRRSPRLFLYNDHLLRQAQHEPRFNG